VGTPEVTVVLDCSVAITWCFEADDDTDRILDAVQRGGAVVPSVWAYEIANVLAVASRRGRITATDRVTYLDLLRVLPIEIVDLPIPAVSASSRRSARPSASRPTMRLTWRSRCSGACRSPRSIPSCALRHARPG